MAERDARILVVDDQPMVGQACANILTAAGYGVFTACGGREATDLLAEEPFDLLLADLKMPEIDGLIVLHRARKLHPHLAAIMMTSYATLEHAIAALRAGAQDFLIKPFDPDELLQVVKNTLAAHRQEQAALEERVARQQIADILDRISDGIVAFDAQMNYTYVNARGGELLGRQPTDLIGKNYWEEYPEAKGTPFAEAYQGALETQTPIVFEDYYAPWDRWFENRIYPSPAGLSVFFTEITARKHAEEALRKKSEELDRYFENSLDLLCIADTDGYFQRLNPEWEKTLGYPLCELEGKQFLEFVHPDDVAATQAAVTRLASQTEVIGFVNRYRCQDGTYRWIEWRSYPEGQMIFAVARDITEQVRAEQALRRNEHRLRLFVEHSPAALAMFDRDMRYMVASRRYLKDYDLGQQELAGRSYYEVFPEIPERWKEIHRRCLAGAVEKCDKDPFPRADGRLDWVRWEIHPWYESSGEIGGIILFSEVITERVQTQEEIRQRAEELAALNALGHAVSQTLSPDEVARKAVDETFQAVRPDLAFLFQREGERLLLKSVAPAGGESLFDGVPEHRVGECMCGLAVSEGQFQYSRDIFADARCTWEECKKAGLRSFAALPLRSGEEIIGVIGLAGQAERDFQAQAEFLETLASQVAVAIRNAELYQEVQQSAAELEQRVNERTAELKRMIKLMSGREIRMIELKDVIKQLRAQAVAAGLKPAADDPLLGEV